MSESNFDGEWRAFTEEDAALKVPARVQGTVMAAWDAGQQDRAARNIRRGHLRIAILAAAAGVAVITAVGVRLAVTSSEVSREGDPIELSQSNMREASAATAAPPSLVRFVSDTPFDTESLRLVRLRVPRRSLDALGIALIEPDHGGLVDIEAVVGDDGLPLEILRALPVVAIAQ